VISHAIPIGIYASVEMRFSLVLALFIFLLSTPSLPESRKDVVTGHFGGLPAANRSGIRVALIRYDAPCVFVQAPVRGDGSFQFEALVTGVYSVAVTGLPNGYALKAISSGNLELLSESLRVDASEFPPAAPIQINVAPMAGSKQDANIVGDILGKSCVMRKVAPVYPPEARKARVEGSVTLSAKIVLDGSVADVKVIDGNPQLVQSASIAVRQWKYTPSVFRGELIAIQTTVIVPFTLQ